MIVILLSILSSIICFLFGIALGLAYGDRNLNRSMSALLIGFKSDILCKLGIHKWVRNHGFPGFKTCKYFCWNCHKHKGTTYNWPEGDGPRQENLTEGA